MGLAVPIAKQLDADVVVDHASTPAGPPAAPETAAVPATPAAPAKEGATS